MRQIRNAVFNAARKADQAKAATARAGKIAAKAAGAVAGVEAAKKVSPPVTCEKDMGGCKK